MRGENGVGGLGREKVNHQHLHLRGHTHAIAQTHTLDAKFKVIAKHNQLWEHPIPHIHTRQITNHKPPSLWVHTCSKGGRGGWSCTVEARGQSSPLSPTLVHWQQQVWWPADMQLLGWESALCDRDNGRSEGRSELEGERRGAKWEERWETRRKRGRYRLLKVPGGEKEREGERDFQSVLFIANPLPAECRRAERKNRSKTNTYSSYNTPVVLQ